MVTKELGDNIVFTLTSDQQDKVVAKSMPRKSTGKTPKAATTVAKKVAAKAAPRGRPGAMSSDEKDLRKQVSIAMKKIWDNPSPNPDNIKALRAISMYLNKRDEQVDTDAVVKKLTSYKPTKIKIPVNKTPKIAAIAASAYKQGLSYLKQGITNLESVYFSDAADLFKLSAAISSGETRRIKNMYFDTNIRDDMPKALYNFYDNIGHAGWKKVD
jgi:hypothetical protein